MPGSPAGDIDAGAGASGETELEANRPPSPWDWATFLLPMVVYMVVGSFEPKPPDQPMHPVQAEREASDMPPPQESSGFLPEITYDHYPLIYTAKIVLTLVCMVVVSGGYRAFPFKVHWLSIVIGIVGVVLWIGICNLKLEEKILGPVDRVLGTLLLPKVEGKEPSMGIMKIIGAGERPAFNPLEQLAETPTWAYMFLAIRFAGLALIVPVIEEFFLRGFLMRYAVDPNWSSVPFGVVNRAAVILGTAVPMLMHPGELLATLVWFSMVTWLMIRTRNIWDCVVAHAITNLLLGIYVVSTGEWHFM